MAKVNSPLRQKVQGKKSYLPETHSSGSIFLNGEFTLGIVRDGERTTFDHEYNYLQESPEDRTEDIDKTGWPLSLSNVLNSHTEGEALPNPRMRGITAYGRKMVKGGAYALEMKLGKKDLCFATLTVPPLPHEERRKVARHWGELGRQLLQFISRRLIAEGRSNAIVGVTEIQERRLNNSGEGYLHFHLVYPAHSNKAQFWALEQPQLQRWWMSALERVIGCPLGILPRVETKVVRKSAEGYLGKYLSKGSTKSIEEFCEDLGPDCLPGQWWIMSKPLRDFVKARTIKGRALAEYIECLIMESVNQSDDGPFLYLAPILLDMGGMKIQIGWKGRLKEGIKNDLYDLFGVRLT